jgi:hypothetical protein
MTDGRAPEANLLPHPSDRRRHVAPAELLAAVGELLCRSGWVDSALSASEFPDANAAAGSLLAAFNVDQWPPAELAGDLLACCPEPATPLPGDGSCGNTVVVRRESSGVIVGVCRAGHRRVLGGVADSGPPPGPGIRQNPPVAQTDPVAFGERRAEPGEVCTCGRPAVTVFVGTRLGETGYCGRPDGGEPGPCPFCGDAGRHDGMPGRCPEYRVRPA